MSHDLVGKGMPLWLPNGSIIRKQLENYIYEKESIFSGIAQERANALMNFYKDDEIKGIFDISGGYQQQCDRQILSK